MPPLVFPTDLTFYAIGLGTTFLMALGKGAFGGGLAILGVPLLALIMGPIEAAIVTACLVAFMDFFALGSFERKDWSKPDLTWLVPGLLVGLGLGFLVFETVDRRIVALVIGLIGIAFTIHYFAGARAKGEAMPPHPALGLAAGTATGFTTFVAHAGGPPLTLYLLRRGLSKTTYAATAVAVFTIGNMVKLPGYIYAGLDEPGVFWKAALLAPAVPAGVLIGRGLLDRLPRATIFNACYVLVGLGCLKLVHDAARALGA